MAKAYVATNEAHEADEANMADEAGKAIVVDGAYEANETVKANEVTNEIGEADKAETTEADKAIVRPIGPTRMHSTKSLRPIRPV
jgi:hypothetical protein